jgi:hypothetical protein
MTVSLPMRQFERASRTEPRWQTAVAQLAGAREYSIRLHAGVWDFALELSGLLAAGATSADLRWLIAQGYLDFATETTLPGDAARRFHQRRCLAFSPETCFILTDAGVKWIADQIKDDCVGLRDDARQPQYPRFEDGPCWDAAAQVLQLAGRVVKRYLHPSPNQELVLAAFEEEGWPRRIDDPLRPAVGVDPKQRLRDTIRTLNAKQENRLIRFRAAGTGEHVIWESVEASVIALPAVSRRRAA